MTTFGTDSVLRNVPKSPSWFQVPVSRMTTASALRYSVPGRSKRPMIALGIHEIVARRPDAGDDQVDFLAQAAQHLRQSQLRAEPVGIGPDVRGDQEMLLLLDQIDEWLPVERHESSFR